MSKKFRSLLDELDSMIPERDKYNVLESRASHFIQSGINLIKLIEENFSPTEADELTRRLFNSLRGRDPKKFTRKIKQLKENQERDNDK